MPRNHDHLDSIWTVLLQHPALSNDLKIVCSLLCTSWSMLAAVAVHGAGLLDLDCICGNQCSFCSKDIVGQLQHQEDLIAWLSKHGGLLRSLHLGCNCNPARDAIAAALQHAMQTSLGGLRLQAISDSMGTEAASLLLQQLPSNHLTSLVLLLYSHSIGSNNIGSIANAVALLTGLRELQLFTSSGQDNLQLFPALSHLTQLTSLAIEVPSEAAVTLQLLPVSLKRLELARQPQQQEWPLPVLQLQRLTAITALGQHTGRALHIKSGDQLPTSLVQVSIARCQSLQPLLPLRQLQGLSITDIDQHVEFMALSSLKQLVNISLQYRTIDGWLAAANRWRGLPIRELGLVRGTLPLRVLQEVAHVSALTSLRLAPSRWEQVASQDVADIVRQLTLLQHLSLDGGAARGHGGEMRLQGQHQAQGCGVCSLMGATAALPDLHSCFLTHVVLHDHAAALLATATQLSGLTVVDCNLRDYNVIGIVYGLSGLCELDIQEARGGITDAVLPVIAHQLTQLSKLYLMRINGLNNTSEWLDTMTQLVDWEIGG